MDEVDTSTCSLQSVHVCSIHKLRICSHLTFFSYHSTESLTVTAKILCNFKRCFPTVLHSPPQTQINSTSKSSWFQNLYHELNGEENVFCYTLKKKKEQVWDPGDSVTEDNMLLQTVKIAEAICNTKRRLLPMFVSAGSHSALYIDKILAYIKIVQENGCKYAFFNSCICFSVISACFLLVWALQSLFRCGVVREVWSFFFYSKMFLLIFRIFISVLIPTEWNDSSKQPLASFTEIVWQNSLWIPRSVLQLQDFLLRSRCVILLFVISWDVHAGYAYILQQ